MAFGDSDVRVNAISNKVLERALCELGWQGKVIQEESFVARLVGFMVLPPCDKNGRPIILAFPNCNAVHTCGMRFYLDIAFIAEDGQVLSVYEDVAPGRFLAEREASFVLERPSVLTLDAYLQSVELQAA